MKYSIVCPKCQKRAYINVSAPGDVKCKCPSCGELFPVHISRASFAQVAQHHHTHGELSKHQLNRRLAAFFIGSATFVFGVIACLFAVAFIYRNMNIG
ncbi:MAG: hypothetical protein K5893_10660 [Prevotella sp.]|nr:hypothetical protein [Prevotella sp.]